MLVLVLVLFIFFFIGTTVLLGWYSYNVAKKISFADENMTYLFSMFDAYKTHLKNLYELEEFHGDGAIKGAILHTDTLLQIIDLIIENNDLTEYDIYDLLQEVEMEENKATSLAEQEGDGS